MPQKSGENKWSNPFDAVQSLKSSNFCLFVSPLVFQAPGSHFAAAECTYFLENRKRSRCCCNVVTSRESVIFSPNGLHEPSLLYCCSKLGEKRGKKKFSGSPWGKRERADLKQESETETKMFLWAKNVTIAMVSREQWAHGEKNLVLRI